jgi:hypothetical protein
MGGGGDGNDKMVGLPWFGECMGESFNGTVSQGEKFGFTTFIK